LLASIVALNGLDMKKREILLNTFVTSVKSTGRKKVGFADAERLTWAQG
jgi:hypothetical protein